MTTSVVYPAGIAPALGHLHGSRNEIEIFVEDKSAKNVWRELLKRFLPSGVKFDDPIQLGSRDKVLEECRRDQDNDGRKKLYIIDADLDLIKGRPKPRLKHLYRLRSYCIENYLLSEEAILSVATALDTNMTLEQAKIELDYNGWLEANSELLGKLFVCYASANHLSERHQTIGYSVVRLTQNHPLCDMLCPSKTSTRVFGLYRQVSRDVGVNELRRFRLVALENILKLDPLQFASGKDYLLPLVRFRLRQRFGGQIPEDTTKVLLARSTPRDVDPYLISRLKKICRLGV